jgi:hypothetical protein
MLDWRALRRAVANRHHGGRWATGDGRRGKQRASFEVKDNTEGQGSLFTNARLGGNLGGSRRNSPTKQTKSETSSCPDPGYNC